jgi:small subunit ribosomal protein S5
MKPQSKGRRGGGRREKPEYDQKLLSLARVTRVVKGGRRFRFRATLVIGNRKGKVGVGVAKGNDVSDSIQKAFNDAKKNLVSVRLVDGTIPHDVLSKEGSAKVLLKPGKRGRGLIAGGAIRAVSDLLGVKDIVSKSLGSSNALNLARATVKAFGMLPQEESREEEASAGKAAESVAEKPAEKPVKKPAVKKSAAKKTEANQK